MAFEYCMYRFLNKNNQVIYVGRTSDLETRLKSHFGKDHPHSRNRNRAVRKVQYAVMECKAFGVIFEIYLINLWKPNI